MLFRSVLDAAYAEYVRCDGYKSGIELVGSADNVVMCRTFSKIYGLAALRLGWLYGPAHVVDALNRIRGPFNVSQPPIAAGVAAMTDVAHTDMRPRLSTMRGGCPGWRRRSANLG